MRQKKCPDCGETDPQEFAPHTKARCKTCYRRWYKKFDTPENKQRRREYHQMYGLLKRYGITEQQFQEMLRKQGGRCDICQEPLECPHVDHDHATGTIRGLICKSCNLMLGHARDNPLILQAAIDYLKKDRPIVKDVAYYLNEASRL